MLHGDLVTMTERGILLHQKAVQHLGIFGQSQCWGVWVENPIKDDPGLCGRRRDHQHLIVSPFHPTSWPFLVRLQLWLTDRPGSMMQVADLLERCGLSILFSECAPSGFGHATWNVVAEVVQVGPAVREAVGPQIEPQVLDDLERLLVELRARKTRFDSRNRYVRTPAAKGGDPRRARAYERAVTLYTLTAGAMMSYSHLLQRTLDRQSVKTKGRSHNPWFHWKEHRAYICKNESWAIAYEYAEHRRRLRRYLPSLERLVQQLGQPDGFEARAETHSAVGEHLVDQLDAKFPRSIDVEWIVYLAYFAYFGGGMFVPIAFHFDREAGMLALDDGSEFSDYIDATELPLHAVASFSDRYNFLRIDPVIKGRLQFQLSRIAIEYEDGPNPERQPTHLQGLIARVCGVLHAEGVDILYLANKWTRYTFSGECGRVDFVVDADPDRYASIARALKSIHVDQKNRTSGESTKPNAGSKSPGPTSGGATDTRPLDRLHRTLTRSGIQRVTITEFVLNRLFFSYHFGHPREESLMGQLDIKAREYGFKLVAVRGNINSITSEVMTGMRSADALLQVYSFNRGLSPEDAQFPWLDFEFGQAIGLGIPALRMVDTVQRDISWWEQKIRTQRDVGLFGFRTDTSDADLLAAFGSAMAQLARAVVALEDRLRTRD